MATGPQITPPRVEFIDPRTGQIARTWYLFLYNLVNGFNTNTTDLSSLQLQPGVSDLTFDPAGVLSSFPDTSASLADLAAMQSTLDGLMQTPVTVETPVSSAQVPPSTITVTGSPFSYQNTTTFPADTIVFGGTVSKVEFSRDGTTWYDVGVIAGMFGLSPSDRLRVTYTVAPTMTLIPR